MTGGLPPEAARNVRIDAQPGSVRLYLDEIDVSEHVLAYRLEHDVHHALPQLTLHTRTPSGTLFAGLARVAVAADDPGQAVADFLTGIDPLALEQAALARPDLGPGKGDLTRAMLRQLTDWALGGEG
ncbi:MAG TPA: hypothetical protein VFY14_06635 [Streptomyces sp.]|nr:hypothetical protein [Streptomyces sp.]